MKRAAPDPEFVLMYRKGISTSKIAALESTAETTVRWNFSMHQQSHPPFSLGRNLALPEGVLSYK